MKNSSEAISMETRLIPNPDMVLREEDDDCALLFNPDSGSVQILNLTAATIWNLLDGQRRLSEVMAILKERFEEMDSNAEDQILQLVRELHQTGALATLTEVSK